MSMPAIATEEISTRIADAIVRPANDEDSDRVIALIDEVYSEYQGCVLLVDEEEPEGDSFLPKLLLFLLICVVIGMLLKNKK